MARLSRNEEVTLTAKPAENPPFEIYANRVDITRSTSTEDYFVASLAVNFGVIIPFRYPAEKERRKEAELLFSKGRIVKSGTAISADGESDDANFYSIDLSRFIPEGWEYKVAKIGSRLNQIGIMAYRPGHESELEGVHVISNSDLHNENEVLCLNEHTLPWMNEHITCHREAGHLNDHQVIDNRVHHWGENGGAASDPYLMFGFVCRCPHCGTVSAGPKTGEKVCSTCSFWLMHAKHREDALVIEGKHYRPGKGGFGGHIFKVLKKDGTRWDGELFHQGTVPSWFRDMFPDNAEFIAPDIPAPVHLGSAKSWQELFEEIR